MQDTHIHEIIPTKPKLSGQLIAERLRFSRVMMVLQLLWVIWIMPETKGIPLKEIQKELGIE